MRERLTGLAPPSKARAIANLWRPWIEGRARALLNRMPDTIFDQDAFGRLTRDLLAALNLADQLDQTGDEGREGQDGEAEPSAADAESEDFRGPRARRIRFRRRSRSGLHDRRNGGPAR